MMEAAIQQVNEVIYSEEGNQHVTFTLGEEEYGIDILAVQEIIGFTHITHVPHLPDFIRGVINLRGMVVPVMDLRLKFGLGLADYSSHTCIIVVKVAERTMGMVVDAVSEVVHLPDASIEPAPSFGARINTDFIQGMGKVGNRLVIILDVEKILSNEELQIIAGTA